MRLQRRTPSWLGKKGCLAGCCAQKKRCAVPEVHTTLRRPPPQLLYCFPLGLLDIGPARDLGRKSGFPSDDVLLRREMTMQERCSSTVAPRCRRLMLGPHQPAALKRMNPAGGSAGWLWFEEPPHVVGGHVAARL
ncbi:hypothetical protein NDU88_001820 [Pleurodeles waltl]|uniref:Uncharacterized protein n=1 Tax=Pleurodeles waltl TaxID=8319 RepID=A0AAV7TIU5_PLEWA|nr:hypothetical protein NDU88_001820 [Pleurodeles waltl]